MKNSKCFNQTLRALWAVSLLTAVCLFGFDSALADSNSVNDSANKAGNNFGELLKGMGQELKKVGKSDDAAAKKDKKKEKKRPETEPDKNKEKP